MTEGRSRSMSGIETVRANSTHYRRVATGFVLLWAVSGALASVDGYLSRFALIRSETSGQIHNYVSHIPLMLRVLVDVSWLMSFLFLPAAVAIGISSILGVEPTARRRATVFGAVVIVGGVVQYLLRDKANQLSDANGYGNLDVARHSGDAYLTCLVLAALCGTVSIYLLHRRPAVSPATAIGEIGDATAQ